MIIIWLLHEMNRAPKQKSRPQVVRPTLPTRVTYFINTYTIFTKSRNFDIIMHTSFRIVWDCNIFMIHLSSAYFFSFSIRLDFYNIHIFTYFILRIQYIFYFSIFSSIIRTYREFNSDIIHSSFWFYSYYYYYFSHRFRILDFRSVSQE